MIYYNLLSHVMNPTPHYHLLILMTFISCIKISSKQYYCECLFQALIPILNPWINSHHLITRLCSVNILYNSKTWLSNMIFITRYECWVPFLVAQAYILYSYSLAPSSIKRILYLLGTPCYYLKRYVLHPAYTMTSR